MTVSVESSANGLYRPDFGPAAEYHEARPPYHPLAFEDIAVFAGMNSWSRALDVGAGTGRATVPLYRACHPIELKCIDPSRDMLNVLEREMGQYPIMEHGYFEDSEEKPDYWDLVFCAEAWHWLDSDQSFSKVNHILKPHGTLAILYNTLAPDAHRAIQRITHSAYDLLGTEIHYTHSPSATTESVYLDLAFREDFYQAHPRNYPNPVRFNLDGLVNFISTLSTNRQLPPEQFHEFVSAFARTAIQEFPALADGIIELPFTTSLIMAKSVPSHW